MLRRLQLLQVMFHVLHMWHAFVRHVTCNT
jgi:hypothetical protein